LCVIRNPAVAFQTYEEYRGLLKATRFTAYNKGWRNGFYAGMCAVVALVFVAFVVWECCQ
jgi:hypothetical protein